MKKKDLTDEEIKNLPWTGGEKWALVDRRIGCITYASDTREFLEECLERMTSKHPLRRHLQLVERPKTN